MNEDELKEKINSLDNSLKDEQDAVKKTEIENQFANAQAELKELENIKGKNKDVVPLYKFKKLNDQLKEKEEKLKKFEFEQTKRQEDEMKKKGELEGLLSKKEEKILGLESEIQNIKNRMKDETVKNIILKEANKFNPFDETDILNNINMSNIEIHEEDGKINISGIESEINGLKKNKPYLFKMKEGDNKIPGENDKTNTTPESVEIEFRTLQEKPILNPREQIRFKELGQKLKELRLIKAGKT